MLTPHLPFPTRLQPVQFHKPFLLHLPTEAWKQWNKDQPQRAAQEVTGLLYPLLLTLTAYNMNFYLILIIILLHL